MDNPAVSPTIVVGVSGSSASARALRWAADEAQRLHARLTIVLAWRAEARAFYAPSRAPQDLASRQQHAMDGLAATVRAVLGPEQAVQVTTEVTEGNPERALIDLSAGADLLVLGSASGQFAGRFIGPVVRTCLNRAHCPVVVVGPEGQDLSSRDSASSSSLVAAAGEGKFATIGAGARPQRDRLA